MSEISEETGKKIHYFRQARGFTLDDLAKKIHKSKATISKYESGAVSIDIETLCEISDALQVAPEQLLFYKSRQVNNPVLEYSPAFFRDVNKLYACFYDGRNGKINHSVIDILSQTGTNRFKVAMYMNYGSLEQYHKCENTYLGYMEHFDVMSLIEVTHRDNPMEKASIQIPSNFNNAPEKWGMWNGISSRPLMPVALKMLFSKKPLKEDAELIKTLKISKDDIRVMKMYNFFSVM